MSTIGSISYVDETPAKMGRVLSPDTDMELRRVIRQMIVYNGTTSPQFSEVSGDEEDEEDEEDEVYEGYDESDEYEDEEYDEDEDEEVLSSFNSSSSSIVTLNIHNPTNRKLDQLRKHFQILQTQVPKFQFELEQFEDYRDIKHNIKSRYKKLCTRKVTLVKSPLQCSKLNRELDIISQRPNILETEMYADLTEKCASLKSIMDAWMERKSLSPTDSRDKATTRRCTSKGSFAPRMAWEMDKMKIILARVKYMMKKTIKEMTGDECDLTQVGIPEEVEALTKAFLWLVLKDQKRYEQLYPTGEEFDTDDDVEAMSYIDQKSFVFLYCSNVARCTIPEEMQDYLSCHFANGMKAEFNPEEIRSRASSNQSVAEKYIAVLTQLWTFVDETSVSIDTHKMIDQTRSPSESPVSDFKDDVPSEAPEPICEEDTSAGPARDAAALEEKRKRFILIVVNNVVSMLLQKGKLIWEVKNAQVVVTSLFERTWTEVQGVDFNPTDQTFKKLDQAVFKELCKKCGGVKLAVSSMKLGEPEFGNCVASSVKDCLLSPPELRNAICQSVCCLL